MRDDEHLIPKQRNPQAREWSYDSINPNIVKTLEEGSRVYPSGEDGRGENRSQPFTLVQMLRSFPAVLILAAWNLMLSVPFSAIFFSDEVPLDHEVKQKLGLRLALLSLGIGQTFMGGGLSGFEAMTVWTLAEVAPFYQAFASAAARNCGDDPSTIFPTTTYLISLSTICVGAVFLVCGKFRIGKYLSFFPNYVTLGIIGGIGVWAANLSIEVSGSPHMQEEGSDPPWWKDIFTPHFVLSLTFGLAIRPLRMAIPPERFLLLDPVYFLSIPVIFYCAIALFGIDVGEVVEAGYMFKTPTQNAGMGENQISIFQEAGEVWTMFDISKVQWEVAFQVAPQIFSAAILALMVTAPFIPPIATLLDMDQFSLDREFTAHGISNIISGLFIPGGAPNVACYSSTVLYSNSGGKGKFANFLLASTSFVSFVYGPIWSGYLPRCMAGAILIDMGINLFLEGVAEPSKFESIEYTSIWVILSVMTVFGMTSGLIAALFMALLTSTYSSASDNPVRRMCDAKMFPSSRRRKDREISILDNPFTGRSKIMIIQLQGSLFFGNISKVQDHLFDFLAKRSVVDSIVVFDCTLVNSLDSSACIFFDKIQSKLKSEHNVATVVFVASPPKLDLKKSGGRVTSPPAGSTGSGKSSILSVNPELAFTERSSDHNYRHSNVWRSSVTFRGSFAAQNMHQEGRSSMTTRGSFAAQNMHQARRASMTTRGSFDAQNIHQERRSFLTARGSFVQNTNQENICGTCFDSLDEALASCEDKVLSLAGHHPTLQMTISEKSSFSSTDEPDSGRVRALRMLKEYCQLNDLESLRIILDAMKREVLPKGTVLWNLGDDGVCSKLFLEGSVVAYVLEENDDKHFRSTLSPGSFLGLRSLILNEKHLATVRCDEECVFYSLEEKTYSQMVQHSPEVARVLELSLSRYLSYRLRHVSNRIYHEQSLPI